jgi:predicted HicB family RNase H-like nuclease
VDKILRNINEQLWREVKSQAALDGVSMTVWVEKALAQKLRREDLLTERRDRRRKTAR